MDLIYVWASRDEVLQGAYVPIEYVANVLQVGLHPREM